MTVAGDFSVHYHPYFKVLNNLKTSKTYILRTCGSGKPTQYPNGTSIDADAVHFSVPINGVALGWSTPVPFFEQLDLMDKVKLANPTYVHSPCLQKAEQDGTVTVDSTSAGFKDKAESNTDVELVITDSYGTGKCDCAKDVIFDAPSDDTPLGRAEWIKYISVFFNEEDRANLAFAREKAAYEAAVEIAEGASATHAAANSGKKKKCAWIGEAGYNSTTWAYKSWKLDSTPYKLKYCTDAGMEAVTAKSGGSDIEYEKGTAGLKTALADIDVIIDQKYNSDPAMNLDTKAKVYAVLGFAESDLKTGAVLLRTDKELSAEKNWAWTESGISRPAHVLQGLVHAVWPTSVAEIPGSCFDYFREITGDTIEAVIVKSHTACDLWETANKEAQCVTNIIFDDEMALNRNPSPPPPALPLSPSPAAKPSFIVALVVALVVALIGA